MPPLNIRNHCLRFGVLIGGVRIVSDAVGQPGTLGFVATDGYDRFLVSCYHVLCNAQRMGPPVGGFNGAVFQPDTLILGGGAATPIASLDPTRADPLLDCAAARLAQGAVSEPRSLGIGRVLPPSVNPVPLGLAVLKSGCGTGVTEGEVVAVNGPEILIQASRNYPGYNCSEGGDSGALWVNRETREAIGLHLAGASTAGGQVKAADVQSVLATLRLRWL